MKKIITTTITVLCLVSGFSQNLQKIKVDTANNYYLLVKDAKRTTYKVNTHKSKSETIIFHSDNTFFTSGELRGIWSVDYDQNSSDREILTLTYLTDNEQVVLSEKSYYFVSKLMSKSGNKYHLIDIATLGLNSEVIELVSTKSKPLRASF
jgi:uncharacterized protein YxeA